MSEVANILNSSTKHSLIVLDELGRGTSTFDGLSIAWAVIEHIATNINAKTLVATHYHELTELESFLDCVCNYSVQVQEVGSEIIFLHKIARGASDRSYGIQVAKIAGVPYGVLNRAKEILGRISNGSREDAHLWNASGEPSDRPYMHRAPNGSSSTGFILEEFTNMDVERITPEQARRTLISMRERLRGASQNNYD